MSNMLEQAIADAAALREQAIKNAEHSVIEKYSQQIKEAVDKMLEAEDNLQRVEDTINEAETELNEEIEDQPSFMQQDGPEIEATPSWDERYENMMTKFNYLVDNLPVDEDGMIELDLGEMEINPEQADMSQPAPEEEMFDIGDLGAEEPAADLGAEPPPAPEGEDEEFDMSLQEIYNILGESMKYDQEPVLTGEFDIGSPNQKMNAEIAEVVYDDESSEEESSEEESSDDEANGVINNLHEMIKSLTQQNKQLESVLTRMENHLDETLLSNAKLLYQNRTLSDASLNERQKSKIVEAIANAESPKEAKTLHETLKATVGSTPNGKKDPQSLSESVNRRSNLSSMLNSRQNINESKESVDPFMEKMQKLAGIKKQ